MDSKIIVRSLHDEVIDNINNINFFKKITEILDPNSPIFNNGMTLIHLAIQTTEIEIIKFLLSIGADPNIPDRYGINATDLSVLLKRNYAPILIMNGGRYKEFLLLWI